MLILLASTTVLSSNARHIEIKSSDFHPVHVSYTNVEYIQDNKEFQILFKIFADDFDRIIQNKYNVFLNLENSEKLEGYDKTITKYILEHFKIIINNKDYTKSRLKFLHLELREKAVWLYYIYKFKGKSNKFELKNSLMTDLYHDQTNLLIFNYYGFQKAIRFTNNKTMDVLSVKIN